MRTVGKVIGALALAAAGLSWWIVSSRQRSSDVPVRGKAGPGQAELAQLRQKLLPQPKVTPREVKNLAEFVDLYEGRDWVVRKTPDGHVKRIIGLRIPLGELSPQRVLEFTRTIAPVFELQEEHLAQGVELLQDSPLLSPTEGVRAFRVRQYYEGYPVIDGSLKVFVDFGDASVVVLEGGDLFRPRGKLSGRPVLESSRALERARKNERTELTPLLPQARPEVGVLPSGEAALVYRAMTGTPPQQSGQGAVSGSESGGHAHGAGGPEEIWIDATSGRVVRKRPVGIDG